MRGEHRESMLPGSAFALVGRELELERIAEARSSGRAEVIKSAGAGIGKTRLAGRSCSGVDDAQLLESASALLLLQLAEGAVRHCQPLARSLRDARTFDWLEA